MSDLGSLSECLVDNDPESRARARSLRRKALAFSVILEALLVAALLIWPLLAPGVLTARSIIATPMAPYSGGGAAHQGRSNPRPHPNRFEPICRPVCAPVFRPEAATNYADAPDADYGPLEGPPGGGLPMTGLAIPGGTGDRIIVPEPPRPELKPPVKPRPMKEGVMTAMLIHQVEPEYPAIAKAAHISGTVHLHAIIGGDGAIRSLEIVDGNVVLARAAKAAVQMWRYRPTLLNGEPVEVETYVTVNFVLN